MITLSPKDIDRWLNQLDELIQNIPRNLVRSLQSGVDITTGVDKTTEIHVKMDLVYIAGEGDLDAALEIMKANTATYIAAPWPNMKPLASEVDVLGEALEEADKKFKIFPDYSKS